ncbi:MAG: pilus assembly protein TadG-related protein [Planctomycetaceae bacterium]
MKRLRFADALAQIPEHRRKGVFFVLAIISLVAAMTFVGMSVDLGMITLTRTRMQSAADAAALGAAQEIVVGVRAAGNQGVTELSLVQAMAAQAARDMADSIVTLNGFYIDPAVDVQLGTRKLGADGSTFVETWNTPPYNMVKVTIRRTNADLTAPDAKLPLIFAPVVGERAQSITTEATAFIESRDIVAVLDYSGSMAFDSLFRSDTVNRMGQSAVEDSLDEIWDALVASNVDFSNEPSAVKFPSTGLGLINSYDGTYISSSNTDTIFDELQLGGTPAVVANYWDNWTPGSNDSFSTTQDGWKWKKYSSGTLKRKPASGGSWTTVSDETFPGYFASYEVSPGTPYVPFPQEGKSGGTRNGKPSASESETRWKDYISFAKNNLSSYGYQKKYGYRTLMHYLIDQRKSNNQSEDLWRAPVYPHHAMKEGMTMLSTFLDNLGYGDQLGLVTYATDARIETGLWDDGADVTVDLAGSHLTEDVLDIDTIQRHKQPGHYNQSTGIGYGIEKARELLDAQGRFGAQQAILLMTDGQSNQYPGGWGTDSLPPGWDWNEITDFDGDGAADLVIDSSYTSGGNGDGNWRAALHSFVRAKEAFDAGYVIHAISMGDGADTTLMSAIANMSGGEYVHIPSGATNAEMVTNLQAAFAVMAGQVPPSRLVIGDE